MLISGLTGLYRGIAANIASSAPISAIYTFTYESVKGALLPLFPKVPLIFSSTLFFFLSCIVKHYIYYRLHSDYIARWVFQKSHPNTCLLCRNIALLLIVWQVVVQALLHLLFLLLVSI